MNYKTLLGELTGEPHTESKRRTRNKKVSFWVTDEEASFIKNKANQSSLTMAEFVLTLIKEGKIIVLTDVKVILTELSKQGVNLNQLVRVWNSLAAENRLASRTLQREIRETKEILISIREEQQQIRKHLNSILLEVE